MLYYILALALGGALAPSICGYLGARRIFVGVFCLRGVLLIWLSQFESSTPVIYSILAILFAHIAGFSLLPGLIKAQSSQQRLFYFEYGRVLTVWGMSGLVGCVLNSIFLSAVPTGVLVLGLLTLSVGITLHFVTTVGADLLV